MDTISNYTTTNELLATDELLLQRGNTYFNVEAKSLTTGAKIVDTYANVSNALTGGTLKGGAIYYLSDKYIFLRAIDNNKLDLVGVYYARNADYQAAGVYSGITIANGYTVNATGTNSGVWYSTMTTPTAGDVVIYNNLHWLNLLGAVGTAPSGDATNWEAVANTDITETENLGYIHEFDFIEYDFANDTIKRRIDKRGNDIGQSSIASRMQWGSNKVLRNTVDKDSYFDIRNARATTIYGNQLRYSTLDIKDSEAIANVDYNILDGFNLYIQDVQSATDVQYNLLVGGSITAYIYDLNATARSFSYNSVNLAFAQDAGTIIYMYLNKNGTTTYKQWDKTKNEFSFNFAFTATAYNAGTTYNYGDMMTAASVTYMYINETPAAGNAAPNATYWVQIFDNGANDIMGIDNTYLSWFGTFNITSTAGTEDLKKITVYTRYISPIKLIPAVGLDLTVDSTAYASLASSGQIMASADFTLEGNKREHCIIEYMGTVNSQTTWAAIEFTQYA